MPERTPTAADDVVIAVDPTLTRRQAAVGAREAARTLAEAGVPVDQRVWIVAAGSDDARAARVAAAIADSAAGSSILIHDPREPDGLIFQRRLPGQRRGGVYLNAVWQQASWRIVLGDSDFVAAGLSAWFNGREQVSGDDLGADLVIGGDTVDRRD